jgi:hypothetical protein
MELHLRSNVSSVCIEFQCGNFTENFVFDQTNNRNTQSNLRLYLFMIIWMLHNTEIICLFSFVVRNISDGKLIAAIPSNLEDGALCVLRVGQFGAGFGW